MPKKKTCLGGGGGGGGGRLNLTFGCEIDRLISNATHKVSDLDFSTNEIC